MKPVEHDLEPYKIPNYRPIRILVPGFRRHLGSVLLLINAAVWLVPTNKKIVVPVEISGVLGVVVEIAGCNFYTGIRIVGLYKKTQIR